MSKEGGKMKRNLMVCLVCVLAMIVSSSLWAAEGTDQQAELAKKLANPIASLISVPLQNNWDFVIGPESALRYTLNVQPVIPFSISKDWNLITRTIVPIIYTEEPAKGIGDKTGLGDILQSFFFSPKGSDQQRMGMGRRPCDPLSQRHW
jgi:hypothetical protein